MPSRFDSAFELHAAPQLDQEFAVPVRLVRGSGRSAEFQCAFSTLADEVLQEDSFGTQRHTRLWYPLASDCVIGGRAVTPRAGDYLLEGAVRHEILPDGNEPASQLHAGGARFVVRTKRVADNG